MSIYLASLICRSFSCGNDQITYCSYNTLKTLQNKVFYYVGKAKNIFSHTQTLQICAIIFIISHYFKTIYIVFCLLLNVLTFKKKSL